MTSKALLCVAALFAAAIPAQATSGTPAGFVGTFDGDARGYAVEHGGTTQLPHFGLALYDGDVVRLRAGNPHGRIYIAAPDAPQPIDSGSGAFTVHAAQSLVPQQFFNLVSKVRQVLGLEPRTTIGLGQGVVYRAADLAFAAEGLSDGSARIAKGARIFGLAWHGGVAPFHVTVVPARGGGAIVDYGDDTRPIVKRELGVTSHTVEFAADESYTVTVTDATGRSIQSEVQSVAHIPGPPAGAIPPFVQGDLKTFLTAAWLAHEGPREYRYEAYLEFLGLIAGHKLVEESEAEIKELREQAN